MTNVAASSADWVPLRVACRILGVNESTLRRWADSGRVRSFRTPGGHRRFRRADLDAMVRGQPSALDPLDRLEDVALSRIRRGLQREGQERDWYRSLSEEYRMRMRPLGRRLVQLVADVASGRSRRARAVEEAREIGQEYGRSLAQGSLLLADGVHAFTFFRRQLDEAAQRVAGDDARAAELLSHIAYFADAVLVGATESYERMRKQTRGGGL